MGGFFTPELAWAGFHHLVIKGKAEKPVYLWIHNGKIEIRDAKNIWGKTVTETQWAIREELGDEDVKSLVIGPVRSTFGDVPSGSLLAYIGSGGSVEIAVRDGSAARRLGIGVGGRIRARLG